jgi:hypothetical protein
MSTENLLWGAPRIYGELLKLGFSVAQSSVAKYMVEAKRGALFDLPSMLLSSSTSGSCPVPASKPNWIPISQVTPPLFRFVDLSELDANLHIVPQTPYDLKIADATFEAWDWG